MSKFIDLCLSGDALEEEIDSFVARWHDGDGADEQLHEYLGMSWQEYSLWGTTPSLLRYIIAARRRGTTLDEAVNDERYALAARAETAFEAQKITAWLKSIGKI